MKNGKHRVERVRKKGQELHISYQYVTPAGLFQSLDTKPER